MGPACRRSAPPGAAVPWSVCTHTRALPREQNQPNGMSGRQEQHRVAHDDQYKRKRVTRVRIYHMLEVRANDPSSQRKRLHRRTRAGSAANNADRHAHTKPATGKPCSVRRDNRRLKFDGRCCFAKPLPVRAWPRSAWRCSMFYAVLCFLTSSSAGDLRACGHRASTCCMTCPT